MEENKDLEVTEEIVTEGNDTIKIANEAVATYAGIAVSEVPGVYGMAGGFALSAIGGKKNLTKGIKVDVGEKNAKIDVNIIVEYGARIPEVAFEIQTRVKKSVETMTGLKVSEVNVHVQGVHAITEKEENLDASEVKEENTKNEE
ncbi:MAG: Asp23/Gls24 family envelope stress response protein [Clostridia bacterium]|nr:Asp23/Gls24 family envelope stress response protein [Clostridia bacterium]